MKIYICFSRDSEGYLNTIEEVFDSEEKAEEYKKKFINKRREDYKCSLERLSKDNNNKNKFLCPFIKEQLRYVETEMCIEEFEVK